MHRSRFIPAALAVAIGLYGCGGVSDPAPDFSKKATPATKVAPIFNVAAGEFPIPNDILFSLQARKDPASETGAALPASEQEGVDGTMFASYDPENPVLVGIDHMDGASTLAHIDIKFDGSLDADQTLDARPFVLNATLGQVIPNTSQNVFLLPLRYAGGDPVSTVGATTAETADNELPTLQQAYDYSQAAAFLALAARVGAGDPTLTPQETATFNARVAAYPNAVADFTAVLSNLAVPEARAEIISLDGGTSNTIRITPLQPLEPRTKYLVVLGKSITTDEGEAISESVFYELMSDSSATQTGSLAAIQGAVLGWEQLANGWFGFVNAVNGTINENLPAESALPTNFNPGIAFSYTFTTSDPESVLKSMASPADFFTESGTVTAKKDAIGKLLDGTFNALGASPGSNTATEIAINDQLIAQLTDPAWEYFSPLLAQVYGAAATAAGAAGLTTYSGVLAAAAADANLAPNVSSLAHYMQLSAAEAALNATVPGQAFTFAQAIASQAATNATNLGPAGANLLPQPQSRTYNHLSTGCLGQAPCPANQFTVGASVLVQGELTLPYYLETPDGTDPTPLLTGYWSADEALFTTLGTTLPSTKVTYRVPFPEKNADVTVPVVAVLPSETAIEALIGGCTAGTDCKPANGWPVIIFQHGITANRTNALPLGHALANACFSGGECFATIAIDQPLHGIAPDSGNINNLSAVGTFGQNGVLQERHFYFTASGDSVGVITAESGTSGSLFQNLISFPTGRDNLRQGSVDLMNLLASLGDMDVDGVANGPDFDTSRVYFIGHSLGAVNGLPFLTVNNLTADTTGQPKVKAAAVLNSGGFVTELLLNSPSPAFGAPRILAGLAAAGLTQGDSDLEVFMNVLQGILDSGDSMNFAESLGDGDMSVLLTEIVGGDPVNVYPGERFVDPLPAGGAICTEEDVEQEGCVTEVTPSDQTVPNAADQDVWGVAPLSNAYDAPGSGKNAGDPWMINGQAISVVPLTGTPLAGTEPMVNLLGAAITAEASASNGKLISVTRFTRGDHANPITGGVTEATDSDGNPVVGNKFSSERVFSEMTVQIGSLFATHPSGTPSVTVSDGCVIEDSASNDRSATSGCPLGEFQ